MKKLILLISCLCLLSCQDDIPEISVPYLNVGDKIHIKNTEINATITKFHYSDVVGFYYEDDFGTLHDDVLNIRHIEKVVDNP